MRDEDHRLSVPPMTLTAHPLWGRRLSLEAGDLGDLLARGHDVPTSHSHVGLRGGDRQIVERGSHPDKDRDLGLRRRCREPVEGVLAQSVHLGRRDSARTAAVLVCTPSFA